MSYIIRPMDKMDIMQVTEIEKSIFSIPWSANSFIEASENDNNIYLVCIENDEVVGYCGLWTVLGEGNVTNVAVTKTHRGKGYGSALLKELENMGHKKAVTKYFLEVRQSNVIAQKLYFSLGYEKIGTRKNFYERPVEDAIIMCKDSIQLINADKSE